MGVKVPYPVLGNLKTGYDTWLQRSIFKGETAPLEDIALNKQQYISSQRQLTQHASRYSPIGRGELDQLYKSAPIPDEPFYSNADRLQYKEYFKGQRRPSKVTKPGFLKPTLNKLKGMSLKSKLVLGGLGLAIASSLASGKKEDHNIIPGLHPGSEGLGTHTLRAHSEFGSGWDPLRKMAVKLFGAEKGSFRKMIKSSEFQNAISGGTFVENLGFGAAGTADLMEASFKGQNFKFVKKVGSIFKEEVPAMKSIQGSVGPSVYSHGDNFVAMEYFQGKLLGDINKDKLQRLTGLEDEITGAFGKLHEKGYRHGDTLSNVMLVKTEQGKEAIGLIDLGAARKLSDYSPTEAIIQKADDISAAHDALKTKDQLGFGFTPAFMNEAYNPIEGLHPGSEGLGTQVLRAHSDFGSGYIGLRGLLTKEGNSVLQAHKDKIAKEGIGYYKMFEWEKQRGAREAFNKFAEHKEDQLKFPAMGDRGTWAAHMRGEITEFKKDFASRWDPLRKLATKLYGDSNEAFSKLMASSEFKTAVRTSLKGEGKLLGKGRMGEVKSYAAEMAISGKKHQFEFAAKSTLDAESFSPELLSQVSTAETGALRKVGDLRAPSLYGTGKDFGLEDANTIIMEKFNLTTPIVKYKKTRGQFGEEIKTFASETPLTKDELTQSKSFMKEAHKRGVTHTDIHGENIVRAINPETNKSEIAILDWGMANRFKEVGGIGGSQDIKGLTPLIITENITKKVGRPVGSQEFLESADIIRLEAHSIGINAPRSSRGTVQSIYDFQRARTGLVEAEKHFNHLKFLNTQKTGQSDQQKLFFNSMIKESKEDMISKAATMDDASSFLDESADAVSAYIMKKPVAVPKPVASLLPNKIDVYAKTQITIDTYAHTKLIDRSANMAVGANNVGTVRILKSTEDAIKRNKRFEENSRRSVGIGLRQSRKAGKGHVNFGSTNSTAF